MPQTYDFFEKLLSSSTALGSALQEDLTLVNAQDEYGMTILHHIATFSFQNVSNAGKVLTVLFKNPDLDFSIKEHRGNTPLHAAAWWCENKIMCTYIFPKLVREAAGRGFDFSTLGENGQSVLHIATRTTYTHSNGHKINNVRNVIHNAANSGLNVLSKSGATAFYYAINHLLFAEANLLLDAGANPVLCGSPARNPRTMIRRHIFDLTVLLMNEFTQGVGERIGDIEITLGKLQELQKKMESIYSIAIKKSASEVTKNARVLSLGVRDKYSLFNKLPPELLTQISSLTATNGIHKLNDAEKIAREHLEAPNINGSRSEGFLSNF